MQLIYIDENFCDAGGHNASYALAIQDECKKRNQSCTIYANKSIDGAFRKVSDVVPVFNVKTSALHHIEFGKNMGRLGQAMRLAYSNASHGWALINRVTIKRNGSIVLIAGHSPRVTLAYLAWLAYLSLTGRRATFVFLLHDRAPWFAGTEFRLLRLAGFRQKIRLAAQSPIIAEDFRRRFRLRIAALPTPQVSQTLNSIPNKRVAQSSPSLINVVYLGLASSAKGFGFLTEAICSPEFMQEFAGLVRFTVQYNPISGDGPAVLAGQQLLRVGGEEGMLRIIRGPLAKNTYECELANAHAMVLPYNPQQYKFIQSGIVTQAIAAGKPLLVSAGSNVEQEMQLHGAGISFEYGSVSSFRESLRQLVGHLDALSSEAENRASTYRQMHGAAAYVRELEKMAK